MKLTLAYWQLDVILLALGGVISAINGAALRQSMFAAIAAVQWLAAVVLLAVHA